MTGESREEKRKKVIEALNKARSMELRVIHQYMIQHYGLDDMDYGELAAKVKLIALDEMRHAEIFAERIKELGGEPTTDKAGGIEQGQEVELIFPFDADLEDKAMAAYNGFLEICRQMGDSTSMKIFEEIIDEEQAHFNYFDGIGTHIKKLGRAYLATKAGTSSATGLEPKGFAIKGSGG